MDMGLAAVKGQKYRLDVVSRGTIEARFVVFRGMMGQDCRAANRDCPKESSGKS
jgi:hypothetical protein